MRNSTESPVLSDFKSGLSRVVRSPPLVKGNGDAGYEGASEVCMADTRSHSGLVVKLGY